MDLAMVMDFIKVMEDNVDKFLLYQMLQCEIKIKIEKLTLKCKTESNQNDFLKLFYFILIKNIYIIINFKI